MTLEHIALVLGVVHGDICRQATVRLTKWLKKELGNLITSGIRWCDDLGFDIAACIRLSQETQARYKRASS